VAWIRVIPEAEATGALQKWYRKLLEPWGGVDNIMKIHSLNVRSLKGHYELYKAVMTRVQREMIAVVVSAINHCRY